MRILRLTHSTGADVHRVEIEVEVPGMARRAASAGFALAIGAKDQELIRWYRGLPARLGRRGDADAGRRANAGSATVVGCSGRCLRPARRPAALWAAVQPGLAEFRVEVVTDVAGATGLPWEAMTDPGTGQPLALGARAMVRAQPQAALTPLLAEDGPGLRVLVVIARPRVTDVALRSVAQHLVRLQEASSQALHLDVLRPPAFTELTRVLQAARDRGAPYRVLHFDGHGVWGDPSDSQWLGKLVPAATGGPADVWLASPARPGPHGYLISKTPRCPATPS